MHIFKVLARFENISNDLINLGTGFFSSGCHSCDREISGSSGPTHPPRVTANFVLDGFWISSMRTHSAIKCNKIPTGLKSNWKWRFEIFIFSKNSSKINKMHHFWHRDRDHRQGAVHIFFGRVTAEEIFARGPGPTHPLSQL